jgi:hypothetical protein
MTQVLKLFRLQFDEKFDILKTGNKKRACLNVLTPLPETHIFLKMMESFTAYLLKTGILNTEFQII